MVLTDREIQVALAEKQVFIEPAPDLERYSGTSVDLTLDDHVRAWNTEALAGEDAVVLWPGTPGYNHNTLIKKHGTEFDLPKDGHVLKPRDFILAWTAEKIHIPPPARLAARVEGKSSFARCGITVHITAPTIHPGFEGQIQLEICNIGPLCVRLFPGVPICQLIFEQTLGTCVKSYRGQFTGQMSR